ncbi:hypothetical protein AC244_02145 [Ensifer adhaerens]|uniref:THIF-type NAD/FAD binding fold domain-containing protein n=2 Tax=Ensifer adhaerens TaxID=106592 RepID=A0A0L8C5Y3_ENSAD|nr:hypothetical protein AC244_02145 [Ensifer adhaerens]
MSFVHNELDAEGAARLSGGEHADVRRILMIGAGSAGSMISETLVRQGLFKWTVVDDDTLFPHNVVRHSLSNQFVGQKKAVARRQLPRIRACPTVKDTQSNPFAQLLTKASAALPISHGRRVPQTADHWQRS